jgi:hypothetical protein
VAHDSIVHRLRPNSDLPGRFENGPWHDRCRLAVGRGVARVDAQATTTIRELATIRRTAGGPSQRRGYGEAGDAAGAMVGIATAYDGGCSASRFPHLKEGIGRNFLTRGRALVGGGSGSSPVRWIWLDGGQAISNLWHNSGVRAPFLWQ